MCSLIDFANKVRLKNRIIYADVKRLQRNVLPNGIGSREDAEILISLDRDMSRSDPVWERWLVAMMLDFVLWAERPTGVVDEDTATWLAETLGGHKGTRLTKTGRSIAREVVQEAHAFENEALNTLADTLSKTKTRRAALEGKLASIAAPLSISPMSDPAECIA